MFCFGGFQNKIHVLGALCWLFCPEKVINWRVKYKPSAEQWALNQEKSELTTLDIKSLIPCGGIRTTENYVDG